ncbi:MAG: NADH-quinone oxidoreductase subunit G [Actinobacteria bacterium]|nr:MAG: NADH-quinone oxidoreductase subunit G [Actinomycetota bacterium]
MTATSDVGADVVPADQITATIDDIEVVVPKGTLVIRAAEQIGIEIPRFCDHPLLDPVAACRMCLIEIKGMPKPQPACAIPLTDGMEVHTQLTSTVAEVAQKGVMEFLLVNHPLDCPICDKGGECPLQNQAMTAGSGVSRFDGTKRTFPKPINVSAQILLDRERCVSCARCTRFADQIAGDAFIELLERGAKQQVGIAEGEPFDSYFSGNTVQICPVGALTSADYRFRARPFDLVSTPTICEHCASGCALRTDTRRNVIMRRLAGEDPQVNEDWNCDKGRFAFPYLGIDRRTVPMVRENGELRSASWPEAIGVAAQGLAAARSHAAVLLGGRHTREDAYAYGKFARVALHSDDIDFRARPQSAEERDFLAARVAGSGLGITYADLSSASTVVLVGLEPEEESPIIFLRLRKAAAAGTKVIAISAWNSPGFAKAGAEVILTAPGDEPAALAALSDGEHGEALRADGAVVLVGERLAVVPGGLTAAVELADATGAALAWVPRRAGERGALDAGALAGLLPGGRPLADAGARAEVAAAWGLAADALPAEPGRSMIEVLDQLHAQIAAAAAAAAAEADDADALAEEAYDPARIDALVVAGLDYPDFTNPWAAREAVESAGFVVQLASHADVVAEAADVVLPVQVVSERAGSFTDWEGRVRDFGAALREAPGFTDAQVLALLAYEMGFPIGGRGDLLTADELDRIGAWDDERPAFAGLRGAPQHSRTAEGTVRLATWHHLLDDGSTQVGEPALAATRRPSVARCSAATAARVGAADGDEVTVSGELGSITLPLVITPMPDEVVWLPTYSPGSHVHDAFGADAGAQVRLTAGGPQ